MPGKMCLKVNEYQCKIKLCPSSFNKKVGCEAFITFLFSGLEESSCSEKEWD